MWSVHKIPAIFNAEVSYMLCQTWIKGKSLQSCNFDARIGTGRFALRLGSPSPRLGIGMGIYMPNPQATQDLLLRTCWGIVRHPCVLIDCLQATKMFGAWDLKGNDVERFGAKIVLNDRRNHHPWSVRNGLRVWGPPPQTRSTPTWKVQRSSFCGTNWPVKSSASWEKYKTSKRRM